MTERSPGASGPILLTGGSGQVGWELARSLASLGTVTAPSRRELDLTDPDSIRRAARETAPALIVNAAAYTAVDRAEEESELAMAVNGTAPGLLAEEAKRLQAPLVHFSTDYVFDGHGIPGPDGTPRPYTEADAPAPINTYGRSKLAGEKAVRAVNPVHLILRTGWVYASRGSNFLLTIRRLAAERDELRIVDDQTGSPTWARAIAEATAEILAKSGQGRGKAFRLQQEASGLYHLSAAGTTTWFGFASAIVAHDAAAGRPAPTLIPIPSREYPLPAPRPAYSVLDNARVRQTFGIAMAGWRDQLDACLKD